MDGQDWTRFDERTCIHMRLVAWAMRRGEKRDGRLLTLWRRLAA
jgi:hypothetical protein